MASQEDSAASDGVTERAVLEVRLMLEHPPSIVPAADRCDAVAAANDVDDQVEQSNVVPLQSAHLPARMLGGPAMDLC